MQPDFDDLLADPKHLHAVADVELLYISEHKDFAVHRRQLLKGAAHNLPDLLPLKSLRGNFTPIGEVPGHELVFGLPFGIKRLVQMIATATTLQPRFVHCNLQ